MSSHNPASEEISLAKYLVTGIAGFIGRSIAAALLARGENVRGVDSFITGKRANLVGLEAMEFMDGDLSDQAACARACAGVEIVFHEAALASVPRSVADPVGTNVNCVDSGTGGRELLAGVGELAMIEPPPARTAVCDESAGAV